jgi:flavin reductase (DIM6/NTAB) family NADH-FMN oxidoreductase RutF
MKKSLGAKTIIYPAPVLIIGTYDSHERPNLATVAWGGICCSSPPCIAISLRKSRHSHSNIILKKAFTVNILSEDMVKKADYYGIASGKEEDKFAKTGITPVKSVLIDAPYGKEFPFVMECSLYKSIELGAHTQFVGEILDVKVEESVIGPDGQPNIENFKPFLYDTATGNYFGTGKRLGKAFSIGREILKF